MQHENIAKNKLYRLQITEEDRNNSKVKTSREEKEEDFDCWYDVVIVSVTFTVVGSEKQS